MPDEGKTKKELISEIARLRLRLAELEAVKAKEGDGLNITGRRSDGILYLTDALPVLISYVDSRKRYLFNNRNYTEWFGIREGDLYGINIEAAIGPEPYKEIAPCVEDALAGKNVTYERQVIFRDGTHHHISETYLPHIGEGDKVLGFFYLGVDITERRFAERALIQSNERYRTLVEESFDGIFIQRGSRIVFANKAFCEMMGYDEEELKGMDHWLVYDPEYQELTRDRAAARMRGEHVQTNYEVKLRRKDGSNFDGEIRARVIKVEGETGIQVWVRDITERKKAEAEKALLEEKLRHAQKLEAIGTLAGGIAHDFNNLLMVILGNASLLLMDTDPLDPSYERLKALEKAANSGADLTRQLLGFARGGRYEIKPADLNTLVRDTYAIFGRTRKQIRVHENYADDLWAVDLDRGQMEQVLLNLYLNAWQAMPEGGELYLETKNRVLDEGYVNLHGVRPGRYVQVVVTDTGVGMDEGTRQRIFEPFYTTREMGRGTGLGLAMVYGVIKGHGGIINVYSEKGKGTSFSIYLPASGARAIKEEKSKSCIVKGGGTLLLVDDEGMILEVGAGMLKSLGYDIITAEGGQKAVEVYRQMQERIDLVILDMIMPDMGGGETFDRIKKINPNARVLLSSGYSINGQAAAILKRGCDGFIQKPFSMEELSQKIRSLLANTDPKPEESV
jgi:PAS domain S-box-containing protein